MEVLLYLSTPRWGPHLPPTTLPATLPSEFLGPDFLTLPIGGSPKWGPGLHRGGLPATLPSELGPSFTYRLVPPAYLAPVSERVVGQLTCQTGAGKVFLRLTAQEKSACRSASKCAGLFSSAWPRVPGSLSLFLGCFVYTLGVRTLKRS